MGAARSHVLLMLLGDAQFKNAHRGNRYEQSEKQDDA